MVHDGYKDFTGCCVQTKFLGMETKILFILLWFIQCYFLMYLNLLTYFKIINLASWQCYLAALHITEVLQLITFNGLYVSTTSSVELFVTRLYPFPPPTGSGRKSVFISTVHSVH